MAKYIAIEPLLTKAGRVEPGEVVELGEVQAQQLLELGVVKPAAKAKPNAPEPPATKPD